MWITAFRRAGFDKKRLFYTQGDYGLFQCSGPCCQETWDNEELDLRDDAGAEEYADSLRAGPLLSALREADVHESAGG